MSAVSGATYAAPSFQLPLDVTGRIAKLSREKQDSLRNHIRDVLSARLGDALDDKVNRPSGDIAEWSDHGETKRGVVLTSLKEAFLNTPPPYGDNIINEVNPLQNRYSKFANGESYTYSLEQLRACHQWKTNICTSTPHLDPLIQEALHAAVQADGNYVIGFELDMAETRLQNQLVFAIFEKDGEKEISRVLIPESKL
jgi:hypothetical protein